MTKIKHINSLTLAKIFAKIKQIQILIHTAALLQVKRLKIGLPIRKYTCPICGYTRPICGLLKPIF